MTSKLQLVCLLFIAGLHSSAGGGAPPSPCVPSNPCQHGGVCSVSVSGPLFYTCACANGYTGAQCQTDPCTSSSPCQHGGICSVSVSGPLYYTCACANGYTGTQCQLSQNRQFNCGDGTSISSSLVCDTRRDCITTGFDEVCIAGGQSLLFNCQDGTSIARSLVCNGKIDCKKNGLDERCVASGLFNCGDGTFITSNLVCDGTIDCKKSGNDESMITCAGVGQLKCGGGISVATNLVCDGKIDCKKNGADEICVAGCTKPATLPTTNIAANSFGAVYNIDGSSGTLTCNAGAAFPDGATSKTITCVSGTWSPAPSTIPTSGCTGCASPTLPTNTNLAAGPYTTGTNYALSCTGTAVFPGGQTLQTLTCTNGAWSNIPASGCTGCTRPATLPTANVATNSFSAVYNIDGSSGTLTCNAGFALSDGATSKTITCTSGIWSSTIPASGCTVYRIVGGDSVSHGRLEVYHSGSWGTVCDDNFANTAAVVACRSLGFTSGTTSGVVGEYPGTGTIWLDDVICNGSEATIDACAHLPYGSHNCQHSEDISIICTG